MRTHRIHTAGALEPGHCAVVEGPPAHHLGRVLRVQPGQSVVLFNGDGRDYAAEIREVKRDRVVFEVRARLPGLPEPALQITVAQAVSRGERMDQTLQKCTELGAAAFQPLFSERVEVRLDGARLGKRLEHWRAVVISACEQCGRATVPELRPPLSVEEWLQGDFNGSRLVLAPGGDTGLARAEVAGRVELAAGPEGGFSEAEVMRMRMAGVEAVRFGPRVLRTETAAAAAVAALQALHGDCR